MLTLALAFGCTLWFVWLMARPPADRSVAAFAKEYSVPLTSHNVGQLRRYIRWTRIWRLGGVIFLSAVVSTVALIADESSGGLWVPLIGGYASGSLLAELFRPVERLEGARAASLSSRRVRDFVRPSFLIAVGFVFVASLVPVSYLWATSPMQSWVDKPDPIGTAHYRPQNWYLLAIAGLLITVALAASLGVRALAHAPFPSDTSDRQAVRHAMRSASIMSVIGGAAMAFGVIGAQLSNAAMMLDHDATYPLRQVIGFVPVVCGFVALWGGLLTLTTLPRMAPFSGKLPTVPFEEPSLET